MSPLICADVFENVCQRNGLTVFVVSVRLLDESALNQRQHTTLLPETNH